MLISDMADFYLFSFRSIDDLNSILLILKDRPNHVLTTTFSNIQVEIITEEEAIANNQFVIAWQSDVIEVGITPKYINHCWNRYLSQYPAK